MITTILLVWGIVGFCLAIIAVATAGRRNRWSGKQEALMAFIAGPIFWSLVLVAFICNVIWEKLE